MSFAVSPFIGSLYGPSYRMVVAVCRAILGVWVEVVVNQVVFLDGISASFVGHGTHKVYRILVSTTGVDHSR